MFKSLGIPVKQVSGSCDPSVLAAASQPSREIAPNLPVERDASGLPVGFSRELDIELPSGLYSAWRPEFGSRAIVRSLRADERLKLEGRAAALEIALRPFDPDHEKNAVEAEIAAMFSGFRAMRQQGDDVEAIVSVTRRVLRDFPLWAIARGCLLIAQNQAQVDGKPLDRRYTPNDSEVYAVVAGVVKLRRDALASATALLSAPVEQSPPPRPQQYDAHVWCWLRQKPVPDGKHALRIAADIEARKARQEQAA